MRMPVPMGLSGISTWLPEETDTAKDAVARGVLDEDTMEDLGYDSLPVARIAPPEMAVLAARRALGAVPSADRPGLLLHAWMHYQGHDLWSPAHFIADRLDLPQAVPLGIQQVCNGGAAAIETAVARLTADPELGSALVTTADRFVPPGFDRWRSDYGIAYGDGATALLVHPVTGEAPGHLRLRSIATVAAARLERMHRGTDPFSAAPRSISSRIDMRRTKKAFLEAEGLDTFVRSSGECLRRVVRRCLADAGLDGHDPVLRCVVMPRLGRKTLLSAYVPAVAELTSARIRMAGRDTGHLGAGDAAAGLAELRADRGFGPGDHAIVISAGAGFTWSCLLVSRP